MPNQRANQSFRCKEKMKKEAACILGVGQCTTLPNELKAIDKDLVEEEGKKLEEGGMNVLRMGGCLSIGKEKEAATGNVTEPEIKDWEAWSSFMNLSEVHAIRMCICDMLDKLNSNMVLKEAVVEVLWSIVLSGDGATTHNHNILNNINLQYFVYDAKGGHLFCAFPLMHVELACFLDERQCSKYFNDDLLG